MRKVALDAAAAVIVAVACVSIAAAAQQPPVPPPGPEREELLAKGLAAGSMLIFIDACKLTDPSFDASLAYMKGQQWSELTTEELVSNGFKVSKPIVAARGWAGSRDGTRFQIILIKTVEDKGGSTEACAMTFSGSTEPPIEAMLAKAFGHSPDEAAPDGAAFRKVWDKKTPDGEIAVILSGTVEGRNDRTAIRNLSVFRRRERH